MTAPQSPRENAKLKVEVEACPDLYCRESHPIAHFHAKDGHWIQCSTCITQGPPADSETGAWAAWNKWARAKRAIHTPAPDAGMPPEPMVELPPLAKHAGLHGFGIYGHGMNALTEAQAAEVIRRCADYALLKSYIQRQGKGEL